MAELRGDSARSVAVDFRSADLRFSDGSHRSQTRDACYGLSGRHVGSALHSVRAFQLVHLLVHSYNADQFSSGRYPGDPDGRVLLHR